MADDGATTAAIPADLAIERVFPEGLPARGRTGSATAIVRGFPLTEDHIGRLAAHVESGGVLGTEAPRLAGIHRRHHRLAMLIASGVEPTRAGMACGYHPSTVSILRADPMFAELLDLYNDGVTAEFASTIETMRELTDDILGELVSRMESNPREFTVAQMNELLKTLADRSGHGPTNTTNFNASVAVVDGNTLERIKAAAAATRSPVGQVQQLAPEHRQAIEGTFRVAAPVAQPTEAVLAVVGPASGTEVRGQSDPPSTDDLFRDVANGDDPPPPVGAV